MKLATFLVQGGRRGRFGALLGDQSVVDLQAAGRVLQQRIPRDLMACIRSGASALAAVAQVLQAPGERERHIARLEARTLLESFVGRQHDRHREVLHRPV